MPASSAACNMHHTGFGILAQSSQHESKPNFLPGLAMHHDGFDGPASKAGHAKGPDTIFSGSQCCFTILHYKGCMTRLTATDSHAQKIRTYTPYLHSASYMPCFGQCSGVACTGPSAMVCHATGPGTIFSAAMICTFIIHPTIFLHFLCVQEKNWFCVHPLALVTMGKMRSVS